MEIRRAEADDLTSIDEIYNEAIKEGFKTAHTEPMSESDRKEWFDKFDDKHPLYICEVEGVVLGWLSISSYRPGRKALAETAEVSFYVFRDKRGKGIGSALLKHAIAKSNKFKFHVFIAILVESNLASISLLKKHGFEEWGYLPEVLSIKAERRGQFYYGRIL